MPASSWAASAAVLAPLGFFFELYPSRAHGVYVGASGGFGGMTFPVYVEEDGGLLLHYALELGYELSVTGKLGPGGFIKYERWLGLGIVDPHTTIDSHSLNAGVRWSLF